MIIEEDDYISHYGILRRSGRYPWGSGGHGENNEEHYLLETAKDFLDYVSYLKNKLGLTESKIAEDLGISTTQLRAKKSIARAEQKQADVQMALRLKEKGYSNVAAAERMGIPESTYRTLIAPNAADNADALMTTANMLKSEVDAGKTYLDVGAGVENHIGVSKDRLRTALGILEEQGYVIKKVKIPQVGTGLDTEYKCVMPPGYTQRDLFLNRFDIQQISNFSDDNGRSFTDAEKFPPKSIDPSRVEVKYKEDGGDQADGVIYVRRGVEDISLGDNRYAQVRIKIGEDKYLKGMAMYHDDMPEGVDLVFNTNKNSTGNKLDAMKDLTSDPLLPFGSVTRPLKRVDEDGNEYVNSAMNLVNVEGDWTQWSRNISAQALSKQDPNLASKQLDMTYEGRKEELETIMSLNNPVVKKKLLEAYADGTDSAAVHLKAAALERQNWNVILPVNDLPETEIYAPNYRDGERVALIRYPHGGTFEIPEVTVNNRHPSSKKLIGPRARDAVGINHKVAERLSGADFDGDTVLVVPIDKKGGIKSTKALKQLEDFDPQMYKVPEGSPIPRITPSRKQTEMGKVSNLITDMTIRGAPRNEIARAIKHSMVVIDSEKHHLNFKQSEIDNGIRELKRKYQRDEGRKGTGASTLISRATSKIDVLDRKPRPASEGGPIDPKTGEKVYVPTGKVKKTKKGDIVPRTVASKKLAETSDAHTLSSGQRIEKIYADHSNRLKRLANQARLEYLKTPTPKQEPSARKVYEKEVKELDAALDLAARNKPLERQAQVYANAQVSARRKANPDLGEDTIKKIKFEALNDARNRTGAKKNRIEITDRQWEAIQAGAVSPTKLKQILDTADIDRVKELATPKTKLLMTTAKTARAQQMLSSGYTRAEVANKLGVSLTTLDNATSGIEGGD